MELRQYQQECLDYILSFKQGYKGLVIAPTGTGKSVMLASVVANLNAKWLILQPKKEILEQNLEKLFKVFDANQIGVYSASKNLKELNKQITVATPLSVVKTPSSFLGYNIIVDEAHLVDCNAGSYKYIINTIKPNYLIGYTATPYRTEATPTQATINRMILNERNNVFFNEPWIMQNATAFNEGYLHKVEFNLDYNVGYNDNNINKKGADFNESSVVEYHETIGFYNKLASLVTNLQTKHNKILVFLTSVAECLDMQNMLRAQCIDSVALHSNLKAKERATIIDDFKNGNTRICFNVGILTTGFDMPELDCLVMARPTSSLSLYQQILGRITRKAPNKTQAVVYDLTNNFKRFGNPANWLLSKENKKYFLRDVTTRKSLTYESLGYSSSLVIPSSMCWAGGGYKVRNLSNKDLAICYRTIKQNYRNLLSFYSADKLNEAMQEIKLTLESRL